MWNWLFGPPGWNLCEQSPWCQRNWWACSWLFSPHVLPFLALVSMDFPCVAHAFFTERLSNHWQGLHRTFSEICRKFDAVSLSDPAWNRIMPNARLQIKGHTNSARPHRCVIFYKLDPPPSGTLVLSSTVALHYYKCCTDGSISPGNYGLWPIICDCSLCLDKFIFWYCLTRGYLG
jgi:hypothetical protein